MVSVLLFLNNRNSYKVVTVPDVEGKKVKQAEKILKDKGFKIDIKEEASNDVKKGLVIRTSPKKGASKKKGSIITIYESTGFADVILKDYTGQKIDTVKELLSSLGLSVLIEKKTVSSPKDYIGKKDVIIDQSPKYTSEEEQKLEKDDVITLFYPDILDEYPDMSSEEYDLAKAEDFANQYGLTLSVKDKKGNVISDYSSYLSNAVISQNRTGKIASGVTFTVTIDLDTTSYNLIINYLEKNNSNTAVGNTKTESHKNGDSGNIACPGFAGYSTATANVSYKIDGRDVTVNCYYVKDEEEKSTDESNE